MDQKTLTKVVVELLADDLDESVPPTTISTAVRAHAGAVRGLAWPSPEAAEVVAGIADDVYDDVQKVLEAADWLHAQPVEGGGWRFFDSRIGRLLQVTDEDLLWLGDLLREGRSGHYAKWLEQVDPIEVR